MPNLVVLKTRAENLGQVVELQKHALRGELKHAEPGDLLLLAEIGTIGPTLVQYAMWFKGQRRATIGETEGVWGKHWKFVVEGEGCRKLDHPFSPQEQKASSKNYAQGGTIVYIDGEDARVFAQRGLLSPLV